MTATPLYRELAGPVEPVDSNTVAGMIVPWNVDVDVVELDDRGRLDRYTESWQPGAFDAQATSGNRGTLAKIEFIDTHAGGLGKVGYALELETRDDGEWSLFRVLPRYRDDVMQMIDDGYDGLSVGFLPKRGGTQTDGRRRIRTDAHLVHVAITPTPKYDDAKLLAIREAEQLDTASRRADHLAQIDRVLETRDRWAHLRVTS